MRTVWVREAPGARVPGSRMEAPLRPAWSTGLEPSLVVKAPVETSRQRAESESNSQPGLRSHMALILGDSPMDIRTALPYPSALAASRLVRNAPLPGMASLTVDAWSGWHPGARCE